ncbi:MAG: hypothetical protein Q4D89_06635 [Arachnia propionica]|uniref:hypothetical protein n=1 Tax=Arachnia propionica TaxID=1750 RepID=UPI0027115A6A|nr:hypothetical protein [Arachnia propionica]
MTMIDPNHPQYHGPLQRRSSTGIIIALVVAIVAVVGGGVWLIITQNQQAATVPLEPVTVATPTEETSSAPVETTPSARQPSEPPEEQRTTPPGGNTPPGGQESAREQTPGAEQGGQEQPDQRRRGDDGGGEAPSLPQEFGDFKATEDPGSSAFVIYSGTGSRHITVHYLTEVDEMKRHVEQMKKAEKMDIWTCGVVKANGTDSTACVTEIHRGVVMVTSLNTNATYSNVADIGDDLLDAWGR